MAATASGTSDIATYRDRTQPQPACVPRPTPHAPCGSCVCCTSVQKHVDVGVADLWNGRAQVDACNAAASTGSRGV